MRIDSTTYKQHLIKAIEIQNQILSESKFLDEKIKKVVFNHSEHLNIMLAEKLTLSQLKSLKTNFSIIWNETIGVDTELFWEEINKNNIPFERKDELNFVLEKGRFRRVDQAVGARNSWSKLKRSIQIKNRFSNVEIRKIEEIIEFDENKRVNLLKKCLLKESISKSQYLKFGESMAYFNNCNLLNKYFNLTEIEKLHQIWISFSNLPPSSEDLGK